MEPIYGMQIHFYGELLDDGVNEALDCMAGSGINALFLVTQHDYLASSGFDSLYHNSARSEHVIEGYYYEFDPDRFQNTVVKPVPNRNPRLKGRDLFGELVEAAHERDMRVYSLTMNRWPGGSNYPDCQMRSISGQYVPAVFCHNHPDVWNLYHAVISDVLSRYPLDGVFLAFLDHYQQFGFQQLTDELAFALGIERFDTPEVGLSCFCRHCVSAAEEKGIDVERVKAGLRRGIERGWIPHKVESLETADEVFAFLSDIPEYLEWMRFRSSCFTRLHESLYGTVKSRYPNMAVALNTYGPTDAWKYAADYSALTHYCDWVKPMFYSGTHREGDYAGDGLRRALVRARKATAPGCGLVPGVNAIGKAVDARTLEQQLIAALEVGTDGVILSWDYALIPLEHMQVLRRCIELCRQ